MELLILVRIRQFRHKRGLVRVFTMYLSIDHHPPPPHHHPHKIGGKKQYADSYIKVHVQIIWSSYLVSFYQLDNTPANGYLIDDKTVFFTF